MRCPSCGSDNSEANRFCEECGALLPAADTERVAESPADDHPRTQPPGEPSQSKGSGPWEPGAPSPRESASGQKRSRVALIGLALFLLVVLIFVLLFNSGDDGQPSAARSDSAVPSASAEPSVRIDGPPQVIRDAIQLFNEDSYGTGSFHLLTLGGGVTRCYVGFDADFPELVLITAISSNGPWVQMSVHPVTGVAQGSLREGSDYRSAGVDLSEFEATGWTCVLLQDGSILLADEVDY